MQKKTKTLTMLLAILVAISLASGLSASAAAAQISPKASYYLSFYSAQAYADPGGEIEVWFDVNATDYMNYVGASQIVIQRYINGTWTGVQSYYATSTVGMLATNAMQHVGHVTYQGVPGQSYRAMVFIYASDSNGSDYRTVYTKTVTAY